MTEAENSKEEPYWNYDTLLFEGGFTQFGEKMQEVRGKIHIGHEPYGKTDIRQEITPVGIERGTRTYIHMKPYILIPDMRLTIGLYDKARPDGAIGKVISAHERGKREINIGQAQAYSYPDGTIVLWECYLFKPYYKAGRPDAQDQNLIGLWLSFEQFLIGQFPQAERITTARHDPMFEDEKYITLLTELGYSPVAKAAYGKPITRS